ncbi:cell surface protein [Lactiplantibacillus plantarum]|uniref:cell surface protein n=1 Tax=Lactiplantibacillus plantarum TaxID=1590 RepID=UPI00097804EA|nr:cell surface protein [Lactiplantibacillus plantarum]MCT3280891.1 cell surface protein [Lactiplantibacillus plantarum]
MVQRFSVCVATILISLIMLTITGVAAVGGRSTVTVSFYAGQRTQQQIDNRNVKIPNGTRPYRVVTEKTLTRPKGYYQLPQTDEQLLTWFYASFGSVLLILLMVIRWFNKESCC